MVCNKRKVMINFIGVISVWKACVWKQTTGWGNGNCISSSVRYHSIAVKMAFVRTSRWGFAVNANKDEPFSLFSDVWNTGQCAVGKARTSYLGVLSQYCSARGPSKHKSLQDFYATEQKPIFMCLSLPHEQRRCKRDSNSRAWATQTLCTLRVVCTISFYRSPLHKAFLLFAVPQCWTREQQGLNVVEARCTASSCKIKLLLS